ncbi:hypothetical protein AB1Y20_014260 [Prymnesium parvum]|uniref:protein xylosyltransferase n=1 Tax=Prymnesium parvum TaxID=97485 RepID=A0AB34ID73_PRYPA
MPFPTARRRSLLPLLLLSPLPPHAASEPPPPASDDDALVGVDAAGAQLDTVAPPLLDFAGQPLPSTPKWHAFRQRCAEAARRALELPAAPPRLTLFPEPLSGVSVAPRRREGEVRLVYVVIASRGASGGAVARLLRALYDAAHLFLIHVDLKAPAATLERLQGLAAARSNVHVMKTRRLVQWGGFTMVLPLLDALASFVDRLDFDFVIPLSDSDLALRTNEEMVDFLRPFRGRSMLRVYPHAADGSLGMSESHAVSHDLLARHPVIECGGFGFITLNASLPVLDPRRPCCFGASGPVVSAAFPFSPPQPRRGERIFRGSQWGLLSAELAKYLVHDAEAHRWARILERRLLADELYLPSVVMNSRFRRGLVNHHFRAAHQPHEHFASPDEYWASPRVEWGGAMYLNASAMADPRLARGEMLFARKFIPPHDAALLLAYDGWMGAKLRAEPDVLQPPVAAAARHADPLLLEWRAPHYARREGEAPPRRAAARRRVARLRFSDGSSCSCGAACGGGGEGEGEGEACCAHAADARQALCLAGAEAQGGEPRSAAASADERRPPSTPLTPSPSALRRGGAATRGGRVCPAASEGLASGAGGESLTLLFANRTPFPVQIISLDAEGGEVALQTIATHGLAEYEASTAHAWRVRSMGGQLLLELNGSVRQADEEPVVVHIVECVPADVARA